MEALIDTIGSYSIGSLITAVAAIVFMYGVYKKVKNGILDQYKNKSELDEKIQKILDQEAQYPEWRQQSRDIQKQLTSSISDLKKAVDDMAQKVDEIERQRRQQKCNELREGLLTAYRYYTDEKRNPMQAWSEMEERAFWDSYGDYEKYGGNGHMHDTVKPAMRLLEVIPMHEKERVAELMRSRG